MLFELFPFLRPAILSTEFERKVFKVVARHVSDKNVFREELTGIQNLENIPLPELRQKMAADLYLLLERNISEEQARGRIPREELREEIIRRCHPERAEGNFALFFLPHYERQIKMFERFTEMIFARTRELLGPPEYAEFMKSLEKDPVIAGTVKGNAIQWKRISRQSADFTPPVRRDKLQGLLQRIFRALTSRMTDFMGEMRVELMLQETYRKFHLPIEFIEDSPKVLLLVPDNFLEDERIALMGKSELEAKLREKSRVLETTLAEVQGEKLKLSELTRGELENKVQERTAELVAALTETQEARQNLEEFSSLATHELRTPIAAIRGYLDLISGDKRGRLNENQTHYLMQAARANERLLTLVNAMLNVSRIELGTLAIEPSPTYLPDIADSVLADLAPKIKEKKQKLVKSYDRLVPIIDVDPSLVHAIFENLLSNAVKYTPEGGGVAVAIEKKDPSILITVRDSGYGIPAGQQPKIFQKLFRADNARAKVNEGTGLGLYLVKSILDETGGKIWFESEENKGTVFFVSIPLAGMKKREGARGLS